jgi:hypothetical protein
VGFGVFSGEGFTQRVSSWSKGVGGVLTPQAKKILITNRCKKKVIWD